MRLLTRDLPGTGGLHKAVAGGLRRRRAARLRAVGRRHPHLRAHREARAHHRRGGGAALPRARRQAERRRRRRAEGSPGAHAPVDLAARRRPGARARPPPSRTCASSRRRATATSCAPATCAGNRFTLTLRGVGADGLDARRAPSSSGWPRTGCPTTSARSASAPAATTPPRGKALLDRPSQADAARASATTSGACWSAPTSRSCSTATSTRASTTALVRHGARRRRAQEDRHRRPLHRRRRRRWPRRRRASTPAPWSSPARCSATR